MVTKEYDYCHTKKVTEENRNNNQVIRVIANLDNLVELLRYDFLIMNYPRNRGVIDE